MLSALATGVASTPLVTGSLLVGNAILWGLRPGKYVATANRTVSKAYDRYIQPSLDRWLGRRPPLVRISRQDDIKDPVSNKVIKHVFRFESVEVINLEALDRKIAEGGAGAEVIDLKTLDAERLKRLKGTTTAPPLAEEPARGPLYDIRLEVTKPDGREISLGEIDFANWKSRQDFKVIITRKKRPDVANDKDTDLDPKKDKIECNKVLNTLKILPKVLTNGVNSPTDDAIKITVESGGFGLVDWWRSAIQGKTVIQHLATDEAHPFLQEEKFVNSIAELATEDKARDSASTIIDNYFAATELSLKNQLKIAKEETKRLDLEVKARERRRKIQIAIAITAVVLTVVLTAGLIAASFFAPPIVATLIGGTIVGTLGFVKNFLFGSLNTLGFGAMFAGIALNYNDYHREMLKESRDDLADIQRVALDTTQELAELTEEKEGAKTTLEAIMRLQAEHEKVLGATLTLNLDPSTPANEGHKMGAMGAKILRNFLSNPRLAKKIEFCKKLILSGNSLEKEELLELAQALEKSGASAQFQIQEIDLTNNPIQNDLVMDGLLKIQEALAKNFTVTNFKCDDFPAAGYRGIKTKKDLDQIKETINKETLVNLYLQQGETPAVTARLGNLTIRDLKAAAEKKIAENFTATNIPYEPASVMPEEIKKTTKQNKLFTQLNSLQPDVDYGNVYINAFMTDPGRCTAFFNQPSGLNADAKPKIREAISQNIFALLQIEDLEKREIFLRTLFGPVAEGSDIEKNIRIVLTILKQLQEKNIKNGNIPQEIIDLFKKGNIFTNLSQQSTKELTQKLGELQKNKDLTKSPIGDTLSQALTLALNPKLKSFDTLEFKKSHLKLLVNLAKDKSTFATFINTYKTIPKEDLPHCFDDMTEDEIYKLAGLIAADIYEEKNIACTSLKVLDEHESHRIALLTACFSNRRYYPEEKTPQDIKDKTALVSRIIKHGIFNETLRDTLTATFKQSMHTYSSLSSALKDERRKIATEAPYNRAKLDALDQVLRPDLGEPSSIPFKIYQLKQLLTEHRPNNAAAFADFVKLYTQIPKENLKDVFASMDPKEQSELVKLITADVYDGTHTVCTKLKTLKGKPEHLKQLLETCFSSTADYPNETDPEEKAALVARMIAIDNMFADAEVIPGLREQTLYYAFTTSFLGTGKDSYDTLKEKLENKRKEIATSTADRKQLNILDQVLNPALRPDSTQSRVYQLKMLINQHSGNRAQTFKDFIDSYENIPDDYDFSKIFDELESLDEFVEWVRTDIAEAEGHTVCPLLQKLSRPQRLALLETCFKNKNKYQSETHVKEKAALISGMMQSDNPAIIEFCNAFLRSSIQRKGKGREPYTYVELLKELKNREMLETSLEIVRTELQEDLSKRFSCLQDSTRFQSLVEESTYSASFGTLKKELAKPEYHHLTKFDFGNKKVMPGVRTYVANVCALKDCIAKSDLDGFIKKYNSILPAGDGIISMEKFATLQLIAESLGDDPYNPNLEALSKLDSTRRIALLAHCFSINDSEKDALEKAILVSTLIDAGETLDDSENKNIQNIRYYIYWAIKPDKKEEACYNLAAIKSKIEGYIASFAKETTQDDSLQPLNEHLEKAFKAITPDTGKQYLVKSMDALLKEASKPRLETKKQLKIMD